MLEITKSFKEKIFIFFFVVSDIICIFAPAFNKQTYWALAFPFTTLNKGANLQQERGA